MTGSDLDAVATARLLVRLPREADRDRFVELFCNEDFMVFYPGVLTEEEARDRFDHMIAVCQARPVRQAAGGRAVLLGLSWDTPASTTSTSRARPGWNGDTGWCRSAGASGTPPRPAGLCWPRPARRMRVNCWQSSPQRTLPHRASAFKLGFTYWKQAPGGQRHPESLHPFFSEIRPVGQVHLRTALRSRETSTCRRTHRGDKLTHSRTAESPRCPWDCFAPITK